MHCASLRVIILVPEAGRPDKSEGGAIVSRVRIRANGWKQPSASWRWRRAGTGKGHNGRRVLVERSRRVASRGPEGPRPGDRTFVWPWSPFRKTWTGSSCEKVLGVAEMIPGRCSSVIFVP